MPTKRRSNGNQGNTYSTRFASKLFVAFGAMLLVTLVLAWYFHNTVEWYEHDIGEIARTNDVLQDYQSLARQTWSLLSEMSTAVATNLEFETSEWPLMVRSIEDTVDALRRDLGTEAQVGNGLLAHDALVPLDDLERVLEQILAGQGQVAEALEAGNRENAAAALQNLYDAGLVALFEQMTETQISERQGLAARSQLGALNLAEYVVGLLPVLVVVLVAATVILGWLFSRSLTRSLNALQEGVLAFSSGKLNYRVPQLREAEFRRLGEEFNTMAHELEEHRAHLGEANVKLEAIVEERTRALKESNAKLAAIDDHRRQLLADISHEFRTPLTVIQGEAEIALRGGGKVAEEYRDSLQRILEQSRQTTRLVDDLLFIARAEVGEPRLHPEEVPVVKLLDSVCEDFSAKATAKDIVIHRHLPESSPVLYADAGRVRQVFSILLDNAIKYSGEDSEVEVQLERGNSSITVNISDRGIGLSEEDLQHVFIRYYRSKRAQRHEQGTGLGLPVAKAIVEAHNGEIALRSREGGGIVSSVILPLEARL